MRHSYIHALAALTLAAGCHRNPSGPPKDPGVVTLEGALGNRFVEAAKPSEVVARLRLHASRLARARRPPINVALVVDTSGSMEGKPIRDARAASLALIDALEEGDFVSVVAFDSRTQVLVPSTRMRRGDGGAMTKLKKAIDGMQARGTTDMQGGLQAGLAEVMKSYQPAGINRIVMLGDGEPNEPSSLSYLAQSAGQQGVAITTLGLGVEYDETLMTEVAQRSGGQFHYLRESSEVPQMFREEIARLHRAAGRNLVLTLTPGPGIKITGVPGQPAMAQSGPVSFTMGDLAEGEERDLVIRLSAQGRRAGAPVELLDAVLAFDDAVAGAGRLERRTFFSAHATGDSRELESGRNLDVEKSAARAQAAATVLQVIAIARAGDLPRARILLDEAEMKSRAETGRPAKA